MVTLDSFTTAMSIHLWTLVFVTVTVVITAHPIINTNEEQQDETVSVDISSSSDIHPSQLCKQHLKTNIERCLVPFEQKLIVFKANDTSAAEREQLRPTFCQ